MIRVGQVDIVTLSLLGELVYDQQETFMVRVGQVDIIWIRI